MNDDDYLAPDVDITVVWTTSLLRLSLRQRFVSGSCCGCKT